MTLRIGFCLLLTFLVACGDTSTTLTPRAPSNLMISTEANTITLNWRDNSNDETGFVIYRKEAERSSSDVAPQTLTGFEQITTTLADVESYQDVGLKAGTYLYAVAAIGALGNSAPAQLLPNQAVTVSENNQEAEQPDTEDPEDKGEPDNDDNDDTENETPDDGAEKPDEDDDENDEDNNEDDDKPDYVGSFAFEQGKIELGETARGYLNLSDSVDCSMSVNGAKTEKVACVGEIAITPEKAGVTKIAITAFKADGFHIFLTGRFETADINADYKLTFTTGKNMAVNFLIPEGGANQYADGYTITTSANGEVETTCFLAGATPGIFPTCNLNPSMVYKPEKDFVGTEIVKIDQYNTDTISGEITELKSTTLVVLKVDATFTGSQNIQVKNKSRNGEGSLRQALIDAAPNAVISFSGSLKGQTISPGQLVFTKSVTLAGDVKLEMNFGTSQPIPGIYIAKGLKVTLKDLELESYTINDGAYTLENVYLSNLSYFYGSRSGQSPSGAIVTNGETILKGSTKITKNKVGGVTVGNGGKLILKDEATISENTSGQTLGSFLPSGGVYVASGGQLVGVSYDGAGNSSNIFDNKPDNIYFAQ